MRDMGRITTLTAALAALLVVGCSADRATEDPTGAPDAAAEAPADTPAPEPAPAPAPQTPPTPDLAPDPDPDPDERPRILVTDPDLDWPFDDDVDRMLAFPALVDAAFDEGAEAGLRFLAEHSWPDGYSADALLACRTSEPTPTYAELDADGYRYRIDFDPLFHAPGFQYPPTSEYPASFGLRVYLGRLIVVTEESGEAVDTYDDVGRMAVHPDGRVVMFATCFPFLPGQFLEHRVTDGHVGGYTDAEAEGDIRLIFLGSPPNLQAEVCERHAAGDLDALDSMIVPPDIEFTEASIPRHVMDRTVGELCRSRLR